jgi:4-carboxymuconolactone decarboxylase
LHIEAAINCGVTRDEIIEIITQMIAYAGFPAATNALMAAKDVFDDINQQPES